MYSKLKPMVYPDSHYNAEWWAGHAEREADLARKLLKHGHTQEAMACLGGAQQCSKTAYALAWAEFDEASAHLLKARQKRSAKMANEYVQGAVRRSDYERLVQRKRA